MLNSVHSVPHWIEALSKHAMVSIRTATGLSQDKLPYCFRLNDLKSSNLYEITIKDLQSSLAAGRFTSVDYVRCCIDHIRRVRLFLSLNHRLKFNQVPNQT